MAPIASALDPFARHKVELDRAHLAGGQSTDVYVAVGALLCAANFEHVLRGVARWRPNFRRAAQWWTRPIVALGGNLRLAVSPLNRTDTST